MTETKRKKICHIVQHPYPSDVRVRKEAMVLISKGHEVFVIALRGTNEARHEVIDGVSVHRIGFHKKRSGPLRYMFEYAAFFVMAFIKLNVLDARRRFDVIHINTLPDLLVFAAVIQKLRGAKVLLDMHEIMPEFFTSKFSVSLNHPVVRLLLFIEKISLRFADEVITVNEPIKRIFRKRSIPDKPITVVMNTVSSSSVTHNEKCAHEGFNCVYHGTLTDIYGLDIAIEGFSRARKDFPDMSFHIFGNGPCLPELKALTERNGLKKSVIFHGEMPYEKMMASLAEMDLGLLATRKDIFLNLSFSNKLAEYLYLKIPVVSSDLDTTKEYFDDSQILFFEAGNPKDLAKKIAFAYQNIDHTRTMAESAYKRTNEIDWDVMAKRYIEVIERI